MLWSTLVAFLKTQMDGHVLSTCAYIVYAVLCKHLESINQFYINTTSQNKIGFKCTNYITIVYRAYVFTTDQHIKSTHCDNTKLCKQSSKGKFKQRFFYRS